MVQLEYDEDGGNRRSDDGTDTRTHAGEGEYLVLVGVDHHRERRADHRAKAQRGPKHPAMHTGAEAQSGGSDFENNQQTEQLKAILQPLVLNDLSGGFLDEPE